MTGDEADFNSILSPFSKLFKILRALPQGESERSLGPNEFDCNPKYHLRNV